jgi:hypothetical protein
MGNSFSFDDKEFAEQPEEDTASDAADEALQDLEQSPVVADSEEDPELQDVDLRLEIADYYRAILKHQFFDTSSAPAAKHVDKEIRGFVRERLEVLLGLRDPRVPEVVAQFDEDEVKALKIIAAKVNGKPSLVTAPAPMVAKMPAPPTKKPVIPARPKPQVKKIPAPPPAPSSKPVAKKPESKPAAAKPQPQKAPVQQKAKAPPKPKEDAAVQTYIDVNKKQVTLVEGETIEEKGRKYLVVRNDAGTLFRKDVTGQVIAPGRIPPMSVQQMSIMSQQQAEAQLNALDETTGIAIVASLTKEPVRT